MPVVGGGGEGGGFIGGGGELHDERRLEGGPAVYGPDGVALFAGAWIGDAGGGCFDGGDFSGEGYLLCVCPDV